MGYYTYYRLSLKVDFDKCDESGVIEHLRDEIEEAKYAIDESGDSLDEATWYSCREDVCEFSKQYQNISFLLSGRPCVPNGSKDKPWAVIVKNGVIKSADYKKTSLTSKSKNTKSGWHKIGTRGEQLEAEALNWSAVTDVKSKLMWAVNSDKALRFPNPASSLMFSEADVFAQKANEASWCGFNDWRVPTFSELRSLRKSKLHDGLYIDRGFFPDIYTNAYIVWSKDINPRNSGEVLIVNFGNHEVNDGYLSRYTFCFLRLVRSL